MNKDFVYLASASPRRSELLRQIGVPFEVRPADIREEQAAGEGPEAYVVRLAAAKAEAVWAAIRDTAPRPVLAADTAVVLDGTVLGKPRDAVEAAAMRAALRPLAPRADGRGPARRRGRRDAAQRQRSEIPRHDRRGAPPVLCDG